MDTDTTLPTCYRHADRETRLACSQCGRPACIECLRAGDVGQRCPECDAQRSQTGAAHAVRPGPAQAGAPFTMAVLGIGVALFGLRLLSPELWFALADGGIQDNAAVGQGEWYRLLTAAFLHADLTHILFNMWALYVLGPPLERQVGTAPFAALYLAAAVAGGVAFAMLVPGGQALGASGAIFGLFGAWLTAGFRNRHTVTGQAGFRQMLLLLGLNVALPLIIPRIAWQAHLGGLLAGIVVTAIWSVAGLRGHTVARTVVAALVGLLTLAVVVV